MVEEIGEIKGTEDIEKATEDTTENTINQDK